jgi:hypothetical protein
MTLLLAISDYREYWALIVTHRAQTYRRHWSLAVRPTHFEALLDATHNVERQMAKFATLLSLFHANGQKMLRQYISNAILNGATICFLFEIFITSASDYC